MFDNIYVQKTDTTQISNAIKRAANITSEAQTKAVDKWRSEMYNTLDRLCERIND